MSKRRDVVFAKPEKPEFLRKLTEELGYKEGPTLDTKREQLPEYTTEEDNNLEEQPLVVVLNPGDLTAAEVEDEKKKLKEKEDSTKADLNQRVVFRPTAKRKTNNVDNLKSSKRPATSNTNLLSFGDLEEEEEEEE